MKCLLKKFREDKKGFTLAELLVVVAIVAILVAISVPIFTAQLAKAQKATNQANMRAAKVAAVAQYMTSGKDGKITYYKYNLDDGTVTETDKDPSAATNGYKELEISNASGSEKYTDIMVIVKAADNEDNNDKSRVEIYVKKSK